MFLHMFRLKKKQQQQKQQQTAYAHLVGQPRAAAITALKGIPVEFVALKAGEPLPTVSSTSAVRIVTYDAVTELILSVA
jgi:hypothetical protein